MSWTIYTACAALLPLRLVSLSILLDEMISQCNQLYTHLHMAFEAHNRCSLLGLMVNQEPNALIERIGQSSALKLLYVSIYLSLY